MNNYEKIKNMSIEEMQTFIYDFMKEYEVCAYCPIRNFCHKTDKTITCKNVVKQWLESEEE